MWHLTTILLTVMIHSGFSQNTDNCRCVTFTLCREDGGTIITDGEGLINERFGPLCPECDCKGANICCSLTNETIPIVTLKNTKGCGYQNPDGVGYKIDIETTDTLFGEFPWMVAIFENGKYRCGGSLIHPSVVLTAAHCVKLPTLAYTIRVGEWDSGSTVELLKHQDLNVDSIKVHKNFNPKNYHNDIALIFLEKPVNLSTHINTACLVPSNTIVKNVRCIATGWGKDRFDSKGPTIPILKKVDLPILENSVCQKDLRETRLGPYFNLDQSFLCAGGEEGKDTCTGDGGGPLFCPIEEEEYRYQLVGITAWGLGCNDKNVPGVYVNVTTFRKWIDKQMKNKNFDSGTYKIEG